MDHARVLKCGSRLRAFVLVCIAAIIVNSGRGSGSTVVVGTVVPFPTVYSLIPNTKATDNHAGLPTWRDYPVLGKLELIASEASAAFRATIQPIKDDNTSQIQYKLCVFRPRHAVTFPREGKHYEVLSSFQCSELHNFCDGNPFGHEKRLGPSSYVHNEWYFTSKADNLNAFLTSKGIAIENKSA